MSTRHNFTPFLQPTNVSCTQTATAILLSHYEPSVTPDTVLAQSGANKEFGSSMQQLATYCIDQGYSVEMRSFDSLILDFTWSSLLPKDLIAKLELIKDVRNVASLGPDMTRHYIEEYITFIRRGGQLVIHPYPTVGSIGKLLAEGPICVAVNYTTMSGDGHSTNVGLRESQPNELDNDVTTHAILVYGQDEDGNFLIADPWGNPATRTLAPDQLIASIMAAQWLCDNIFFRIIK